MWNKIVENLHNYPTSVLTGIDPDGYPFSIRCKPQPVPTLQVLRVQIPDNVPIQPGRASLLCHYHDELLWNIKSFALAGTLEKDVQGWLLRPQHFIRVGDSGLDALRFLLNLRRASKKYLQKRGLPRPRINWDALDALKK